ncbi:ribonuclease M5 [Borrelia sp. P9F1]|nr:ribonuclease M5 [Borrelia sp. P9F1]WKC58434.1 ribonuclease M5 [Borrelia sp. P9F1]
MVVEGKDDARRIKELFECTVVETGGFHIKSDTINVLKRALATNGIIIFTDSDKSGDLIRKQILKRLKCSNQDNVKHAHLESKNKEVELSSGLEIIKALTKVATFSNKEAKEGITLNDLIELGLTGSQSRERREKIQRHFQLGNGNNKRLLERINYFQIKREEIEEITQQKTPPEGLEPPT